MLPTANSNVLQATLVAAEGPIVFEEKASRTSGLALIAMLAPLFAMTLVPATLLAIEATRHDGQGSSAAALALALYSLAGLVAVPILRLLAGFGRHRRVIIRDRQVLVADTGPFNVRKVTRHLSEFAGVRHRVRTTLSGVCHDLVLVERAAGRQICIHRADRIGQETIALAAERLGLPVLTADAVRHAVPASAAARAPTATLEETALAA